MPKPLCLAAGSLVILTFWVGAARAAFVTSTFDTDAEGWTMFNDGTGSYADTFGNPAGSFRGTDRVRGTNWYFEAPAKFLGDQSDKYGGLLSYDLWVSVFTAPTDRPVGDVVVRGNGLRLKWTEAVPVADTWTTQTVTLDTSAGWVRSADEVPATEAELRLVLSNVQNLWIRGEYHSGPDHGFLDNVVLASAPEPGGLVLLTAALGSLGLWGVCQRRRLTERS